MSSPFGPVMMGAALPDLVEGLEYLTNDGWIQNKFHDRKSGAHCSLGVLHLSPSEYVAIGILAQAIRESGWEPDAGTISLGQPFPEWNAEAIVGTWNDEPGRTWPEVKTMWEAAIKLAETFSPTCRDNVTTTK